MKKEEFKPYISDEHIQTEFTPTSIIIGILLGLIAGYFLEMFILKTCELDILMFDTRISIWSYVYSASLTILFTLIVSVGTYFALKKIDMIESLKSVE